MLTIYWSSISQPSRSVKTLIDLGKVESELVHLDVFKKQTSSPDYLSKNPLGRVPFITHGDYSLNQTNAILTYLCEAFPQKLGKYYGDSIQSKAIVNQFLSWHQGTFRAGLVHLVHLKFDKLTKGQKLLTYQIERSKELIKETLNGFEQILSRGGQFIAGSHFTIADILIFHEMTNLFIYEIPFEDYKAIHAWYNRVLAVEGMAAVNEQNLKTVPPVKHIFKSVKADDQ